jgi:ABC-type Na+ efflux pump permease subunit
VGFVWSTARKELRRHRRDPLGLVFWIGIPLIVGGLIILASGGSEGPSPQAHLLVADEDDSFLSHLLIGALSQDAAGGLIRAEATDRGAGTARMDAGGATALLVIPDGFSRAVLQEEPVVLRLVTNPSQTILPGIVEEGLTLLTDGTFYLHRLIGDDLRVFSEGPPEGMDTFSGDRIAEFSVRVNEIVDRLGGILLPPLITVETGTTGEAEDETGEEEDAVSIGVLFLPGILFMALLFMAQGLSAEFWQEREQRTLRRVVVSPRSIYAFLTGKVVSGLLLMAGVSLIALSIGYAYLSLDPQTLPAAVLWSTLSGAALMAMLSMIQLFASSRRMGNTLTMILIFPLMMIGGSFFPFEAMPEWMAAIGRFTPNGWALEQLKAILLHRVELGSIAEAAAGLIATTVILFFLGGLRLRGAFARE